MEPRRIRRAALAAAVIALLSPLETIAQNRAVVEAELERLRGALGIGQMSAAVAEGGTVIWVRHFGVNARRGEPVRYPIASLTKPFTAALAFKLIEQKKLSLDTQVDRADGTKVSIRQLLTHTAAGTPGTRFLYSSDLFRQLDAPIARAAGTGFGAALNGVIKTAGLRHTAAGAALSPSSGLVSTVEDLAQFTSALEAGRIVARESLTEMFQAPRDSAGRPRPYAHGWFVQQIGGQAVRWHFGQDDRSSSLLVSLPGRRLTFVLLAQGDRLSSPFWLQSGDLRWSPFASLFLSQWVKLRVDLPEARQAMTDALVALASGQRARGATLANRAAGLAPALVNSPDLALLAAFARSGDRTLRDVGRGIARRVLAADAAHPRALFDLAVLNLQDGQGGEARKLLQQIQDQRQASPEIDRLARELMKEASSGAMELGAARLGTHPQHRHDE